MFTIVIGGSPGCVSVSQDALNKLLNVRAGIQVLITNENEHIQATAELRVSAAIPSDTTALVGWDIFNSLNSSVAEFSITPLILPLRVATKVYLNLSLYGGGAEKNSTAVNLLCINDLMLRETRLSAITDTALISAALHGRALLNGQKFALPLLGGGGGVNGTNSGGPGWILVDAYQDDVINLDDTTQGTDNGGVFSIDLNCTKIENSQQNTKLNDTFFTITQPYLSFSDALCADLPGTENDARTLATLITHNTNTNMMRPGAILLAGESGSGKSVLAHAVSARAPYNSQCIFVTAGDIFAGGGEGTSEMRVCALARALHTQKHTSSSSIIIVDDAELLWPRIPHGDAAISVARGLLDTLDESIQMGNALWLILSAHPEALDARLWGPSRVRGTLQLRLPVEIERIAQVQHSLQNVALRSSNKIDVKAELTAARISSIAAHGFSRADMASLSVAALKEVVLIQTTPQTFALHSPESRWVDALVSVRATVARRLAPGSPLPSQGPSLYDISRGAPKAASAAVAAVLTPLAARAALSTLTGGSVRSGARGLLISGRAGEGKTVLAFAIAKAAAVRGLASARVLYATDVASPLVGASEAAIAAAFAAARAAAPCLLVIDGLDILAPARSVSSDNNSERVSSVTATLLAELDGAQSSDGVSLIGVVRDAKALDSALRRPGRLDVHVHLTSPRGKERKALLKNAVSFGSHDDGTLDVWNQRCDELVRVTKGWSRAAVVDLWRAAAMGALRRSINSATTTIISSTSTSAVQIFVNNQDIDQAIILAGKEV